MQVCCKVYGLANTSLGIECALERDLLAVGKCLQHNNRAYVIVSVVESRGYWFANVIPEDQCQHLRRPVQRHQEDAESRARLAESRARLEEWHQRALQAERQVHRCEEELTECGARLDRLMGMLELLTKEPDAHQHEQSRPIQRRRGGEHVR